LMTMTCDELFSVAHRHNLADEAPHLSPEAREELWKSIPSYQRDARTKGIPQLGSGAIYKIADEDILS